MLEARSTPAGWARERKVSIVKVTGRAKSGQDSAFSAGRPAPTYRNKKLAAYFRAEAVFCVGVAVVLFVVAGGGGGIAGGIALCLVAVVVAVASLIIRDPARSAKMLTDRRDASIRRLDKS